MDLLKLVAVFCIIILMMWMKKPLLTAVLAATIGTVVLYQLPLTVTCAAVGKGATSWTTIETLLVF